MVQQSAPVLLALDTSSSQCGVALYSGPDLLYEWSVQGPRIHGASLAPMIVESLEKSGTRREQVRTIAVAQGPGSFTGLRIGVSTAKGLAFALGSTLIGVPTLDAILRANVDLLPAGATVFVVLPSRRGEVFARSYRVARPPEFWPVSEIESLEIEQLLLHVEAPVRKPYVIGQGSDLTLMNQVAHRLDEEKLVPTVRGVGLLGSTMWSEEGVADLAAFEPHYLKEFVAKKGVPIFERLRSSMHHPRSRHR